MSRPAIQSFSPTPNIHISECHPDSECRSVNWWLYDDRAGMNIAMRAKTKEAALVEALDYWAERFVALQKEHAELQSKVDSFVKAVRPEEEEEGD